jgi:hypothetical protein
LEAISDHENVDDEWPDFRESAAVLIALKRSVGIVTIAEQSLDTYTGETVCTSAARVSSVNAVPQLTVGIVLVCQKYLSRQGRAQTPFGRKDTWWRPAPS